MIGFDEDCTACEGCSYTLCTGCQPLGAEIRCPDCPLAGKGAGLRGPAVPVVFGGRPPAGGDDAYGPGTIVPAPCVVTMKRGLVELRPTVGISRSLYETSSPLRRARLALLACIPSSTAAGRLGALRLFSLYLSVVARVPWNLVDPAVVADFVMWRVAPPRVGSVPPPPRGPVEPATAMSDVVHLRAHANATSQPDAVAMWYGDAVTAIFKRLGAGEKYDSVRKTPVALAAAHALVAQAERPLAAERDKMDAFLVVIGILLFLRGGETGFVKSSLLAGDPDKYIGLTFLTQKTRSTVGSKSVSRLCSAPLLLRAYRCARPFIDKLRPSDNVFAFGSSAPSTWVREQLLRILGPPPLMMGETRPLPWSMRAGGATVCFHAGMDCDRLMRLGRWSSKVSLMYAVLTAQVQSEIWTRALENERWYELTLPGLGH